MGEYRPIQGAAHPPRREGGVPLHWVTHRRPLGKSITMEKLSQDQIDAAINALPNWSQVGEALRTHLRL